MERLRKIIIGSTFIPFAGLLFIVAHHFFTDMGEWGILFYLYIATLFIAYVNVALNVVIFFTKRVKKTAITCIAINALVILFYWFDPVSILASIE